MTGAGQKLAQVFPGESDMARRMRDFDWASTPLGDPAAWPEGLKIPLRMLLTSRFEMWLGWGPDLLFFYNDAYAPTLGLKHPSMLGRPFREVWAEVYDDVADQVARVRAGEATWNNALLLLLERKGYPEETYHSFSYSPLHEADGSVAGMLCVVSEETERVISERRLDTLRRLGMALVGATDEAAVREAVRSVLRVDRKDFPFALVVLAGPGGERIWNCTEDAPGLVDHPWPPGAVDRRETRAFPLRADIPWPSGAWDVSPREALSIALPGAADQPPLGALVVGLNPYRPGDADIQDFAFLIASQISGALANVAALDRERQRANQLWSRSRDLMVVIDADGVFRAVNPAWTRILGHRVEDVVGRPFRVFMAPEDVPASTRALSRAIREGDLTSYENRFRTVEGDYRCISWHTAMEDGQVYAYGRDITEQKAAAEALVAAEEALRQAQKMEAVGQLTGGIAHDFNNLLTGIIGSLDIIRRRAGDGQVDKLDRYIQAATTSADKAAALTQRLLAFSRRQTLMPKVVDPNALIRGMADLIDRSIGEAIVCERILGEGAWRTRCDPNQLESAILNLTLNARDAMPDGGRLEIATGNLTLTTEQRAHGQAAPPGEYVTIQVADTGSGMTPQALAQAFEPFFTTKPIGQGTGLGLSMVYGFARQSNGFVLIETQLGQGSSVTIHLPRTREAVEEEDRVVVSPPPPHHSQASKILIVEDEDAVRMLMVDTLRDLGHEVAEAADGPSGLEILQSAEPFDLVVTDVGLPGLNGRQLVDAARVLRPDLKVLFVTGYAYDPQRGDTLVTPGIDVLAKPFSVQAFAERVADVLRARSRKAEPLQRA